jgi:hypothetical protein
MDPKLYDYIFFANPYEDLWYAIPKSEYMLWSNGQSSKGVLKSKDINVLVELIGKGENFIKSLK